jgi:hypothetical protein
MGKEVIVKYTAEDITAMLKERLLVNEPSKFAELIIGHLSQTPEGLAQVTKAMWGIYPTTKYSIGDHVYINKINLPTWRDIDIEKTLELPGNKDSLIICIIIDINLYSEAALQVEFKTVKKDGTIGSDTYYVTDNSVVDVVEDLSDFLSEIEDLNNNV